MDMGLVDRPLLQLKILFINIDFGADFSAIAGVDSGAFTHWRVGENIFSDTFIQRTDMESKRK